MKPKKNKPVRKPMTKKEINNRSLIRQRMLLVSALTLCFLLGIKLFYVQALDPQGAAESAIKNRLTTKVLDPVRGSILDRNGKELAVSLQRYTMVIDQTLLKDFTLKNKKTKIKTTYTVKETMKKISDIIQVPVSTLKTTMIGERRYSIIAKNLTPSMKNEITSMRVPGLYFESVITRDYPTGVIAGNIIGFLRQNGEKVINEGLEASQNERLSGKAGKSTYELGADGVIIPIATRLEEPAVNGDDVTLTIDNDLQWVAQEAVFAKQKQFKAEWVSAVVLDNKTGEILVMADSNQLDPSNPGKTKPEFYRSKVHSEAFEPGSTGKAITFAAAIDQGLVKPIDTMSVANSYMAKGEKINDSLKHPTYDMTVAGIFARSYNTGTVMVGQKMSNQERYEWFKKFGVGEKINIGLPASSAGILAKPEAWDGRQQFTTMFGQGYTQTALHTAQIFQAISNDGVLKQPQLIKSYIKPDGTVEEQPQSEEKRVLSSEASKEMIKLFEGVSMEGTSQNTQIEGYRVGGKSGTAQAAGKTGKYDGYTSSFAGVAPLDDPKYTVVITMHRPQGNWRSWSVQDTFKEIMSAALAQTTAPNFAKSENYKVFVGEEQKKAW